MEINYVVSRKELPSIVRSISKAVWNRRENVKRKYILQAINIMLWIPVGVFIAYAYGSSEELGRWTLYGAGLGTFVVWIYRLIERNIMNQLPEDPGPSLGPIKLVADEVGITVIGTGSKSVTEWSGVKNIEEVGDYVLIFIDNHVAHYVPKKAIGGKEKVESFIGNITSLRTGHAS